MKARSIFLLMLLTALSVIVCVAQTSMGSISGSVADQNEAVIPDALVTIKNVGTGFTRSASTSSRGHYHFVNVPTGTYELWIEAATFSKYVQQGITLDVNQNAVLDAILKPGTAQENITVTENASFLNTTTAEVGTRFDQTRVSEL